MDFKKLKEHLESEEGQRELDEWAKEMNRVDKIVDSQLERFHNRILRDNNFSELIEKIQTKYSSDKYKDREYKIGVEPREPLFGFLMNYAEKYGRDATEEEWEELSGMFTNELYYIYGYYFELVVGQGSYVSVYKEK